jgi:hypothetical protein
MRGKLAGCADPAIVARLSPTPEALVDRTPFSAHPDEIEELEIEIGKDKLVLVRKGSAFLMRAPSEATVPLAAGNARVAAAVDAEATIVTAPDLKRLGLEPPRGHATITMPSEGKAIREIVTLGRSLPDGTLHLRRDDGVVLSLERDAARAFLVDSTLLRDLKLLDFSAADLSSLKLQGTIRQVLARDAGGSFVLAEPAGFEADGTLATDLSFGLSSLAALRWVADKDDGSFGLTPPRLRATLTFQHGDAGPQERTFLVGNPTSGGFNASFAGRPGVFVLERELVEQLETSLINRSGFVVDPHDVTRVELRRRGEKIVLEARGDTLIAQQPSDLPAGQVQAISDALSSLRAEAAVHTGPARAEEGLSAPELEVRVQRKPGKGPNASFSVGVADAWRGQSVHYARLSDVNATFAIARGKLRPLLDAF